MADSRKEIKAVTKPAEILIMGIPYEIRYVDTPEEADIDGHYKLLGQIDYMTRTIRVYDKNPEKKKTDGFPFYVLMHEILHGIGDAAGIDVLNTKISKNAEKTVDLLANVLSDTLIRNDMLKDKWKI